MNGKKYSYFSLLSINEQAHRYVCWDRPTTINNEVKSVKLGSYFLLATKSKHEQKKLYYHSVLFLSHKGSNIGNAAITNILWFSFTTAVKHVQRLFDQHIILFTQVLALTFLLKDWGQPVYFQRSLIDFKIIQSAQTFVYTAFSLNIFFYKIMIQFYFQSRHSLIYKIIKEKYFTMD